MSNKKIVEVHVEIATVYEVHSASICLISNSGLTFFIEGIKRKEIDAYSPKPGDLVTVTYIKNPYKILSVLNGQCDDMSQIPKTIEV